MTDPMLTIVKKKSTTPIAESPAPVYDNLVPEVRDGQPSRRLLVAWKPDENCLVNLGGNYDYLELPYYVSQDYEAAGHAIHPTCKEMLDAYVPPLCLTRAGLHKLAVPTWYVSNGYFEPPVIVDPINPFMTKSRVLRRQGMEQSVAKSMTRNFTYAVCCQELQPDSRIVTVRSLFGWCTTVRYRRAVHAVWEIFRIPLAKVRLIVNDDDTILLSDISQLPFSELSKREREHLDEVVQWQR